MKEIHMGKLLSSLTIVQAKRQSLADPIVFRRMKLIRKLDEQINLANAVLNGTTYVVKRLKNIKNEQSGEIRSFEVVRNVRPMFFKATNNKLCVQVRYGSKVVELAKGKNAIQVDDEKTLVKVLETVRSAVFDGELDEQIAIASDAVKTRFKK
jgi:hypothetical protein